MDRRMRLLTSFACEGATLGATLDDAPGRTGLLIVSGGTEIRVGGHRGFARLAAAVASAGHPVLRFDRRGIGDSGGDDPGFAGSGPDIAAAARQFRTMRPDLERVLAFGLCDGATALALHHAACGVDGLILANPWVVEPSDGLPPPAAIRRRYVDRLLSLEGWRKLFGGRMDYRAALRGLHSIARKREGGLALSVAQALQAGSLPLALVLADGDSTAIAFAAEWDGPHFLGLRASSRVAVTRIRTRSHSFAHGDDPDRLAVACIDALDRAARPSRSAAA
jgi:exosortase A-associated hydrolase 1